MKLTELLSNKLQGYTNFDSNTTTARSNSTQFSNYLNKAENSNANRVENTSANASKNKKSQSSYGNNNKVDTMQKKSDNVEATESSSGKEVKKSDNEKTDNTKQVNNSEPTKASDFDEANEKIVKEIADSLGISIEAVQQILVAMNIKPLELVDSTKLNEFVQKVMGANSPKELLTMPGVQDIVNKLNEVVANFKEVGQEFIQFLENQEMGKPFFVENEKKTAPVLVSTEPKITNVNSNDTDDNNLMATVTLEADVEQQATTVVDSNPKQQMENSNSSLQNSNLQTNQNTIIETESEFNNTFVNTVQTDIDGNSEIIVKSESIKNVNTTDVVEQIMDKVKVEYKGDTTEIKMILKPESLGEVTMKIATHNGIVTAQFVAENQRVKEIIEAGFNQLRENLQEQGINISQMSVSVGQENTQQGFEQFNESGNLSSGRINQIVEGMEQEEIDNTEAYVKDNEIYDSQVNYQA